MEQKPKEERAVCSSAPATGYATAVDAALALEANGREAWSADHLPALRAFQQHGESDGDTALRILAGEVRRLRAVLADINAIAKLHPDESGREDFETLEVIAAKSHNKGINDTQGVG